MEEKSAERRSRILKVLIRVAGLSVVVLIGDTCIGFSTTSGWEPAVENILYFILFSSMGLFLAAIIGILIIVIIGRRKTR